MCFRKNFCIFDTGQYMWLSLLSFPQRHFTQEALLKSKKTKADQSIVFVSLKFLMVF